MVISRLYVQNFRCFGESPTVINFADTGLTAFVGSNNAGKSSALKAIEILLGDKWPVGQFTEDDFHKRDHSRTIVLACEFDESIQVPVSKGSADTIQIEGLEVQVRYLSSGFGESATEVTTHLLSDISDFDLGRWTVASYGGRADRPMFVSQETRNLLPIAITIPLIKLHSEQPTNKWGVLGRMMQKVENAFSGDEDKQTRFKENIAEAVDVLREPEEFAELDRDVKEFWNQIRPQNLSGTALEFLDYDPWHYYRQFRLAITKNGEDVPLDSLGEGVQRLAVIALYRAYLKGHRRSQKAILLIEEPESYLHPQARSVVYNTLRKAIDGDDIEGQIVYTTHSSDFLDCAYFEEIVLFSETANGSEARQVNHDQMKAQTSVLVGIAPGDQINPEIYYRLVESDSSGLKDALFGSKAVVVEGSTDSEFLKFVAQTEEKQIPVVRAGGKENIPAIYTFLTAFGVPTLICADRDNNGRGTNDQLALLINQPEVNNLAPGETPINSADIDALPDGAASRFRNLNIFSADLEDYLETVIPEYASLRDQLRDTLNIGPSKPKLMFSLGRAAQGQIPGISLTDEQAAELARLSESISQFLGQDLQRPSLITV